MKRALFFLVPLSLVIAVASSCGGKVVVDSPGTGGGGGEGPQSSSSLGPVVGPGGQTAVTTVGPGSGTVTVSSVVSSVTSISSGPMTCDNQGDCSFCAQCAIDTQCAGAWNDCQSYQPCADLLACLNSCPDQACYDKCIQTFPDGIDLYNQAALCIVCQACYNDCDGQGQGCQ